MAATPIRPAPIAAAAAWKSTPCDGAGAWLLADDAADEPAELAALETDDAWLAELDIRLETAEESPDAEADEIRELASLAMDELTDDADEPIDDVADVSAAEAELARDDELEAAEASDEVSVEVTLTVLSVPERVLVPSAWAYAPAARRAMAARESFMIAIDYKNL